MPFPTPDHDPDHPEMADRHRAWRPRLAAGAVAALALFAAACTGGPPDRGAAPTTGATAAGTGAPAAGTGAPAAGTDVPDLVTTTTRAGGVPPRPTSTSSSPPPATQVVTVRPLDEHGQIQPSIHVTDEATGGNCLADASEQVNGAARCFTDDYVADPCWAVPPSGSTTVVCLSLPWSADATRITGVTGAETAGHPSPGSEWAPWGIELATGERCIKLTGAHSLVGEVVVDYQCTDDLSLLRTLDRSRPAWTIRTATGQQQPVAGPTVPIRTAWYAEG
jgi:hypothetical protein